MSRNYPDRSSEGRRANLSKFLSHLIVISMLFILPEFVMGYAMPTHKGPDTTWVMYVKSVIFIAVFYIDFYFIIGRTLSPRVRLWRFLFYNLLLLVAALGVSYVMWYFFSYMPRISDSSLYPLRHPERFRLMFMSSMVRDAVMIILTIALAVALRLSDKWAALERRRRDMADEQRATELRNLKSQLNPHFLFNTLNSIYALIEISPKEAQRAIHELSQMLRYVLYETPATVTLAQETDFLRNYISLMELRLAKDIVNASYDIESMSDHPVPPLLFISLVENAFKHGNTGRQGDIIEISIVARDGHITCRTCNCFNSKTVVDRQGGIGITNLRRRLLLIYGSDATLTTTVEDDKYTALLDISTNKH